MSDTSNDKLQAHQASLIDQVKQIAQGLAQTFAPFCEVVVHDLRDPKHAVLAIHNNLSGRATSDPATELGLARIADNNYPQILANYANQFADGRPAKSTSIGIKDADGRYVAALCMNVDLTLFRSMQSALEQFNGTDASPVVESLDPANAEAIRRRIDQYAASLASSPQLLKAGPRHRDRCRASWRLARHRLQRHQVIGEPQDEHAKLAIVR